jgi:hypothetical protein
MSLRLARFVFMLTIEIAGVLLILFGLIHTALTVSAFGAMIMICLPLWYRQIQRAVARKAITGLLHEADLHIQADDQVSADRS